jgi:2-polyprenyl-3-methyl-5-hydroxy-6-metoxy-1,4-benzoquinol methylase
MSTERQTASTLEGIHIYHRKRYEFARKFIKPGDRVLDLGCGVGYGCTILAEKASRVVGIDIAPEAIEQACRDYARPNIEYILQDCNNGFISAEPFDWVTAFEVVEHVDDALPMFKMAYKVLVPGGGIICSSPNGVLQILGMNTENPYHKKHYTPEELVDLLMNSGFYVNDIYMQETGGFYLSSIHGIQSLIIVITGEKHE